MKKIFYLFALITFFNCAKDDSATTKDDAQQNAQGNTEETDDENCPKPSYLSTGFISNTTVKVKWLLDFQTSKYDIEYGEENFELGQGTKTTTTEQSIILQDLKPETSYTFYVRAFCNDDSKNTEWSKPFNFTTSKNNELCAIESLIIPPQGVDQPSVGDDYINISFQGNNDIETFKIQYGKSGFNLGEGIIKTPEHSFYFIKNLTPSTNYDIYVQGVCKNYGYSEWYGPLTVKTKEECKTPINFTLSTEPEYNADIFKATFNFQWNDNNGSEWEIRSIEKGQDVNSNSFETYNISKNSSDNTIKTTIQGKYYNTSYDFYVRTICEEYNNYSTWIGPITINLDK